MCIRDSGWQRVRMTYENTSDDEYTASVALVVSKGTGTCLLYTSLGFMLITVPP